MWAWIWDVHWCTQHIEPNDTSFDSHTCCSALLPYAMQRLVIVQDCTRENMELSNQLKFLTEEYAKLNEEHALLVADSQHQQSTTISALGMSGTLNPEEEMHRLNKDAQYYRNANKMLKGHLREVLIEYNQQQQRLHISEREIRELTQMNEGLQEQLANLKAYLSNRHNVREHRVDTSKLKALSPEVIQGSTAQAQCYT